MITSRSPQVILPSQLPRLSTSGGAAFPPHSRPLDSFIDGLSVQILLCFAQLLTFQVAKGDDVDREMHQPSELDKNIYEIREKLKALSYILHLYHAVLNNGESSLDKDDLDTFQWLNAVSVPRT